MIPVQTYPEVIQRQNLREKIRLAKELGFDNDVIYWQSELNKLTGEEK